MRCVWAVVGVAAAGLAAGAAADPPVEAVVTDAGGAEVRVSGVRFGAGTRRLAWLADPSGPDDAAKKGPLALELREPHSTTYASGVLTLVPLSAVEAVRYDYDKRLAAVAVKGLAEPLAGTLQYKGVNALALDGTAGGKAVRFAGGTTAKDRARAVAFPAAAPLPARKGGAAWQVQIDQPTAMDPTLRATGLRFLYQYPGGREVATDAAPARKGPPLKLDDAVTALTVLAVDPNTRVAVVEVAAGGAERVVVLPQEVEADGKKGVLVGLVGEVEAGWKLFPLRAVKGLTRPKKD